MDSYTSPPPSSLIILFKRASRSAFFRSADQKSCHQALVFSLFVKSVSISVLENFSKTLVFSLLLNDCFLYAINCPDFMQVKTKTSFLSHMHDIARYQILYILLYNPIARWHICQGSINSIAFSSDGAYIAIVGSDGAYIAINST
ncbi:hypothetical protein LXL04_012511 [Taraxacum kok-saghyz]